MDDILKALAKMLNMTVEEVGSLLETFKGNAPQIYEMIIKEKMMHDIFSLLEAVSFAVLFVSVILLVFFLVMNFRYDTAYISGWDVPKDKTKEEYKGELIAQARQTYAPIIKINFITSGVILILWITSIVLKITLAQNYIFIVNEILPRLTNK
jgi:hypothetical protein|nr:MAG TPA: hypothetical protein [Caudoviricetes sp.]